MKRNLLFLLLMLCFKVLFTQTAFKEYVDGEVYVKFRSGALKTVYREDPNNIGLPAFGQLGALLGSYGVSKATRPFYSATGDKVLPDIIKFRFVPAQDADNFINALQKNGSIEYAEKIPLMRTTATPNDFSISSASVHLTQINAQNAWNIFNGNSNITVAIVDNGVMWTHADLVANTYTNTGEIAANGIDDDGNGYIDDVNGFDVADNDNNPIPASTTWVHGTHCAGIAGATNNNGQGISSIGWNIKLIPVKCEPDVGGTAFGISYGLEGVLYATKAKAKVISCSWGGSAYSAAQQAVVNYAWNRGSIVIFSAGNNNNSVINYPAAYNNSYAVAAVNTSDVKNSSSSYGSWVDISAPGDAIYSTVPYTGTPTYQPLSGTSQAAPMVAGLAALMLSKSPNMTRTDVLNCISSTAQNIYGLSGNSAFVSGNQLGAGRIDAYQAMLCAANYSAMPPVADFYAFPLNACPNTPVSFYDSSLYVPTSWSWSFQGGIPATSTASNPVVQWTTPGTYSVALSVTNASGTHSKTKLSYVTIAAPGALPFVEGFQGSTFLPSGWSPNNIQNDEIYWERKTGVGGFGTSTACAMFDNYTYNPMGEKDEMRSPRYDFSNVAVARLSFDVAYARYDGFNSDSLQVKLSTNCGATWTSIYLRGGATFTTAADQPALFVPTGTQWRTDVVDVSALVSGQSNVMFSFINRGHYGQPIYLDNINIVTPTPTINIAIPSPACVYTAVNYTNTSVGAASYLWAFDGAVITTATATNPAVGYLFPGSYTLSLMAVNGTATATVTRTIQLIDVPHLTVSVNPATICSGQQTSITAAGANTYTWSSGATGSIIPVSPMATTIYTVTGTGVGSCTSNATATVIVNPTPTLTVNSPNVCLGNTVTLQAGGGINYLWSNGATSATIAVSPAATTVYSVTSSNGSCTTSAVATVSVIANPSAVVSTTNINCKGACNGIVNAIVSGATGPFTFSVSATACTALPCTNLCAGTYTLFVSEGSGCSVSNIFTITQPATGLAAAVSITHAACSTCADGALSATVSGGTPAYTYTWLPAGGNTAAANNLTPGCYTLTANDDLGCTTSATACVDFGTGLNNQSLNAALLQIYPNPARNRVTVAYLGLKFNYTVYNSLGQLILQNSNVENVTVIDLSVFSNGLYVIEVEAGKETIRKKIMIE